MAVNLLDMAKGYLTDAAVSRVSSSLNENPEGIQKALTGALPVFLAGMISRSGSSDGPGMLTGLVERFMTGSAATSTPDTNGFDPDTLMSKGNGLVESVFGSGSNLVSGAIAQFSGVKPSSATGIMSMAGSIITGLLGRQLMQGGGVTTDGLVGLLSDQRGAVTSAMPSGLSLLMSSIPGMGALGGLSGTTNSAATEATIAAGSAMAGATGAASSAFGGAKTPVTPAYSDDVNDRPKGFNFWPWLLGALAIGLLVYFLRGYGDKSETSTTTSDTTSASMQDATANLDSATIGASVMVDSAGSSIASAADSAGLMPTNAAAALGTFEARKLPDGIELNIPANGIENKLIAFIEDQSKVIDKTTWFNFDRLLYEMGSAKLKPESREQLQNIAAILKAYPAVNLKIGGYTDNTGNAAANKKLSGQRADAALIELVRLGASKDRLEAEGYGQEIPVASNDTEAGRAQNRRTAVRITKK